MPQGGRDFRDQLMPACVWRALNTKIPALPRFRRSASVMLALPVRASPPKQKSENQEKLIKFQCYDLPSNLYICAGAAKLLLATGALLIEKHSDIFFAVDKKKSSPKKNLEKKPKKSRLFGKNWGPKIHFKKEKTFSLPKSPPQARNFMVSG